MKNQAALYLRSSKDRSDVSIDAQRRALHAVAVQRGLVVVEEFADAVESGKDEDRPAFQRMLHQLRSDSRAWDHVLTLDVERIARRRMISIAFETDAEARGVKVVYSNIPQTDPAMDMMMRTILQGFAEYHSLVSRAKGLAGMAENVRQGWRAGGRAPRGYRLEYHATGAIRDGEPVTKSKLVLDDETAGTVRAYLVLRAQGVARAQAVARSQAPWPASSTHSMDWQALTYAGHTVWGVETDKAQGKRRPRAEWLVQRNTHEAIITDDQAEAILAQMERAQQGRRNRASPLLFAGLVVSPDGRPWHSDGCGHYRLGKGPKISAARLEGPVLAKLVEVLHDEATVGLVLAAMRAQAAGGEVDGRRVAGLERRAQALATSITRTVDLAARMEDPSPVLRRVADLEHQRAQALAELEDLRSTKARQAAAATFTQADVRALLRRLVAELQDATQENERRAEARQALGELLERIELDAGTRTARLLFAVRAGDTLATPRDGDLSPVRWAAPVSLSRRRA